LGTNFVSILIDLFAYLNLKSSSKERRSDAIEAGALHFMNDLLIAIVVILGLALYGFGVWYADSIAALGIVVFILYSSLNVVRDSISALTDAAPRGVVEQLRDQILTVEGIENCHHVRARRAGSKFFVDAHVEIEGHIPLDQAHFIASKIEEKILKVFPNSDVLIHTEPHTGRDPRAVIRGITSQIPEIKGIHGIIVKTIGEKLSLSYHLELGSGISVKSAHLIASRLEEGIKATLKNVSTIISHLEPIAELSEPATYSPEELSRLRKQIIQVSQGFPEIKSSHEIEILTRQGRYNVTLHCTIDGSTSLVQAHEVATKMEEKIKMTNEKIEQVTIHCEPEDETPLKST